MYIELTSEVMSCTGATKEFTIRIVLHLGSALSQYLLDLTQQKSAKRSTWKILFANNIVPMSKSKKNLQKIFC